MQQKVINLWADLGEPALRFITTNGYVKTNGEAVMGRGCAREARDRYPGIAARLGRAIARSGNHVHGIDHDLYLGPILSFPVKHRWDEPADPELIVRSAYEAVAAFDRYGVDTALLPRPGCGNGRLSWSQIEPLIAPILDDRFTVVSFR